MKQDNGWHEHGELPPAGIECEFKRIDGRWLEAKTIGKDSEGRMVCEIHDEGVIYASSSIHNCFRPIRTERDVLIELIRPSLDIEASPSALADVILAAGFSLRAK